MNIGGNYKLWILSKRKKEMLINDLVLRGFFKERLWRVNEGWMKGLLNSHDLIAGFLFLCYLEKHATATFIYICKSPMMMMLQCVDVSEDS